MTTVKSPLHPYLVLLSSLLLPGSGQVLNGQMRRAFTMQMFMIALAFITWRLTPPERDLIGRLSGGLFVYALSVVEAYRVARVRWTVFHYAPAAGAPSPA